MSTGEHPNRSALIEGAGWWNEAFEAAGFINGFQARLLPPDADPMDLRYNVINWVHRSTRGWSSGSSVTDPRTGEIIKGVVTLGSLRVRQDFMIAQGLLSPYREGVPVPETMEEMALARIRQLSTHEIGHTLGLSHNYVSSVTDRSSVMDYPHPLVKINDDGTFDLSDAYDVGIGEWDKVTIDFGYRDFPDGADEKQELNLILKRAMDRGIYFLTDQDARPAGSAHPLNHLWDNGQHPVDELNRVLTIRARALDNFSQNNIRQGEPLATLEDVLVPVYLFHRYQIEAASKVLGGMYYRYNLRGDGQKLPEIVSADEQRRALDALLATLGADVLALDERIVSMIPPRPPGFGTSTELFSDHTGSVFDPVSMAETAACITVDFLLNSERASRLVSFHSRNREYPGLEEVLDRLLQSTWNSPREQGYHAEIERSVDTVVLSGMLRLAANTNTFSQARAITMLKISELKNWLSEQVSISDDADQVAHFYYGIRQIELFEKDPERLNVTNPLPLPAGAPIGTLNDDLLGYYSQIHRDY
ncbi:zinc-dependent metalloprotease [candidate division KSB1 bacterium]